MGPSLKTKNNQKGYRKRIKVNPSEYYWTSTILICWAIGRKVIFLYLGTINSILTMWGSR